MGWPPPAEQPRSLAQQVAEFQNYVSLGKVTFNPRTALFFLLGGLNDHRFVASADVELYVEVLRLPPVPRPPAFSGGDADWTTGTAPGRSASRRLTNAAP